jgi:hypothetical protein
MSLKINFYFAERFQCCISKGIAGRNVKLRQFPRIHAMTGLILEISAGALLELLCQEELYS